MDRQTDRDRDRKKDRQNRVRQYGPNDQQEEEEERKKCTSNYNVHFCKKGDLFYPSRPFLLFFSSHFSSYFPFPSLFLPFSSLPLPLPFLFPFPFPSLFLPFSFLPSPPPQNGANNRVFNKQRTPQITCILKASSLSVCLSVYLSVREGGGRTQ